MAKTKKEESQLPSGFVPLTRKSVDGWYVVEEGNVVQGFLRGSFNVPSQFNRKEGKTVYKIELSVEGTKAIVEDGMTVAMNVGDLVGVDQKGFLSSLADVEEGREVYIKCTGHGVAKKGQSAPWLFDLGVVPI